MEINLIWLVKKKKKPHKSDKQNEAWKNKNASLGMKCGLLKKKSKHKDLKVCLKNTCAFSPSL